MWARNFAFLAVLAPAALALPGKDSSYGPKCKAKPDTCFKAVQNGPFGDYHGSQDAKSDCASFFRTIVTPCPKTSIHTVTQTHYAKPKIVTSYATAVSTDFLTATDDVTSFDTISVSSTVPVTETDTSTVLTTDFSTATAFTTVVVDVTSTVTVTATTTVATINIEYQPLPLHVRNLYPHYGPPGCHASTSTPSSTPRYAARCGGHSAYSSACSCLGATHTTKTLPGKTITKWTTKTKTITPTITKKATTTIAGPTEVQTLTDTTVIPTTQVITITSTHTVIVTVTDTITDITTMTVPTTSTSVVATTTATTFVTATATHCPIIEATGPNAGQYLAVDANNDGFLYWTTDPTQAQDFFIDSDSIFRASDADGSLVLALPDVSSFVPLQGDYQPGDDGLGTLTCSADPVTQLISCTPTGGGSNSIWATTNEAGNSQYLVFAEPSDLIDSGYSEITIQFDCPPPSI